ncbi:transaldolase family protein [Nostoc sp. DedQUE09]|uniref:transaldolase family protein n=1 Tax=Nostoc sp. DedQUE09 TaxID=3075394 RepID=UPI002AD312B7|nr:transaldolase family protein [Nostoc sp. DedQUE09]MDZ7955911.1 transaldolase family protein [Nostoc sp. DedQUE09]
MNLLQSLRRSGQSIWLDGFERSWVSSGQLQQAIEEDGLKGTRSNFDALNLAIQGHEYDRDFNTLAQQGMSRSARSDYEYLLVRDLQLAADRLKQVHAHTQGRDGYVQVDLPPDTLFEAETAIAAAQKIWRSVGWSNLLLRIPATRLMLPVIEQLLREGMNVNATLVFSLKVYNQVFDSYLRGLEKQIQLGKSVSNGVCFVSFAIDRWDAAINPFIADSETSFGMMQSRLLYEHYQSERQRSLPKGAKPLRLVWDCTDIPPKFAWHYIQALRVPETVMLLSPSTLEMYRKVSLLPTRLIDGESDEQIITSETEILSDEQIDQLVNEEMARSLNAYQQLLDTIEHKRASMVNCP